MHKTTSFFLLTAAAALAGCGPAPYAEDPHEAMEAERAPRSPASEPVVVVVQCPGGVSCPQAAAAPVVLAPAPVVVVPPPAPPVVVAPPTSAPIDPYVRWVIARHRAKFQRCYEKGLRRNPMLVGSVVVRLRIDRDGEVDKAFDYGSTLPDRRVVSCVVDAYERIDFKRHVGPELFDRIDFRPS